MFVFFARPDFLLALLLHEAMIAADPHRAHPRDHEDLRELLQRLAQVAENLSEEREQLKKPSAPLLYAHGTAGVAAVTA